MGKRLWDCARDDRRCILEIRAGSEVALEDFVLHHLRWLGKLVKNTLNEELAKNKAFLEQLSRYPKFGVYVRAFFPDLLQEAVLGLINAALKVDLRKARRGYRSIHSFCAKHVRFQLKKTIRQIILHAPSPEDSLEKKMEKNPSEEEQLPDRHILTGGDSDGSNEGAEAVDGQRGLSDGRGRARYDTGEAPTPAEPPADEPLSRLCGTCSGSRRGSLPAHAGGRQGQARTGREMGDEILELATREWRVIESEGTIILQGFYRSRWGRIRGEILVEKSPIPGRLHLSFFILDPPKALLSLHPSRHCLTKVGKGIYRIHWHKAPSNILAGIYSIEQRLNEAFELWEKERGDKCGS